METLFAKIRTQHVSKLDNQRNAASTLLSVEETLREQQTPFTPSAYFAILFALLTEQALGPKQAELREAVVYLLSIVFPELPKPVLRSKYEEILNTLGDIFHQDKESAPIMRSTIGCLQVLLCAQDNRTWELPLTLQAYQALLMCTLDERPKVRRRSQEAIISILSHPISPHIYHPASGVTIEFCHNVLNQCSKSNMNVALHMLHMIKSITFIWSSHSIPKLCELLLKLPKLNNMYLTSASFEVFESLFGLDDYAELESERLSEMLTVILQYKPNFHDAHLMPIWLRVVSLGFTVFAKMEPETCMKSLGQLFNMIFPNMKSEKPEILAATSIALATLVQNCISPQLIHQYEVMVREIVNLVESGLGYQYRIAWTGILALIEALFRRLGRDALPIMSNTLVLLGQLRMEDGFDCKDELDQAIGAAIRSVGPRRVLEILPLNVDQPERKDIVGRAWLLPVLAKYTANTDLYYFINTLIPLGDRLAQRAFSFREAGREIEWKVFLTLAHQVWYLLPGYLTLPIDLPQVWNPAFLERLIGVLQSEPELLTTVCSALRNLVDKYRAFIESPDDTLDGIQVYDLSKEDAQLALNLISQHTKQLLSALLDIYSATDVKSRDSVLKVIQNYMTLLAEEDVNVIYHHVHQLLLKVLAHPEEASQAGLPEAGVLLELIVGMLPYLDVTSLKSVFDMTVGLLNKEDAPLLQKKAHKILWKAVGCERGLAVWQEGLVGIRTHLLAASGQISISAKKYRMLALKALVKLSPVEQLDFVPLILSEAIVCTKEVKEQTRKMAYDLLITMGYRMQEGGLIQMPGDDQQPARTVQASLSEYILMTTAGLAGTTSHMISATIAALSRLVFEFRDALSQDIIDQLLETMHVFIVSGNREVVKVALGFVKVAVTMLAMDRLEKHLEHLITAILRWSHDHKGRFKIKVRHIIERLIRRFGYEKIEACMPESDRKLIVNIRKRRQQAKRRREQAEQAAATAATTTTAIAAKTSRTRKVDAFEDVIYGSESDFGSSEDEATTPRTKTDRHDAWIHEDEDAPVDFLDRQVVSRITASAPSDIDRTKRARIEEKMANAFKKTEDGRLVVSEPADQDASSSEDEEMEASAVDKTDYYLESKQSREGYTRVNNRIKFNKQGLDAEAFVNESDDEETAKKSRNKKKPRPLPMIGQAYRSKKAGGDVKRPGKPDPYAYIPLNPMTLKKRGPRAKLAVRITGRGHAKRR